MGYSNIKADIQAAFKALEVNPEDQEALAFIQDLGDVIDLAKGEDDEPTSTPPAPIPPPPQKPVLAEEPPEPPSPSLEPSQDGKDISEVVGEYGTSQADLDRLYDDLQGDNSAFIKKLGNK